VAVTLRTDDGWSVPGRPELKHGFGKDDSHDTRRRPPRDQRKSVFVLGLAGFGRQSSRFDQGPPQSKLRKHNRPTTPGGAASGPGSAFNSGGTAGMVYAGSNLKIRAMAKPPNMTSLASNSRESGRAGIQEPGPPSGSCAIRTRFRPFCGPPAVI
jgi:hypothetical protein